jgi:multidrug efflux pump subunit AcrA (membrane-fusion protein)
MAGNLYNRIRIKLRGVSYQSKIIEENMGKIKLLWLSGAAALLLVAGACTPVKTGQVLSTSTPELEVDDSTVSATAEVVPRNWLNLSFLQAGRIEEVFVEVGDPVTAGQVLARIDDQALQAAIIQAEAALKRAELARQQLK